MDCAVGVMAHNEEASVAGALAALSKQAVPSARIVRIVVVASGCTDRTADRVRAIAPSDTRIQLIEQPAREGKASAIRLFLREAGAVDLVVLAGADTRPRPGALEALLRPFADPSVGMTGGRPLPLNPHRGLIHRVVHLLWRLHHEIALRDPKLGEVVAFRRDAVGEFPADTAVDEAALEQIVHARGLTTRYVPEAEVDMRGPGKWGELLAQRRRIAAGHRILARRTGYAVSTGSPWAALGAALRLGPGPGDLLALAAAVPLEGLARLLGAWDALRGRDHVVWRMAGSSKNL